MHVHLDEHETWGSLIDNLHVRHSHQRHGIGRHLMQEAHTIITSDAAAGGMHLWVLEPNVNARAFYERLGGVCAERVAVDASPTALDFTKLRMVWAPGVAPTDHSSRT